MHRRNHLVHPAPLDEQTLLELLLSPTRREILLALAEIEQDVVALARELELDVSTIGRALSHLSKHDLVSARQIRRRRHYRLGLAAVSRRIGAVLSVEISIPGELTVLLERVVATPLFATGTLPSGSGAPVVDIQLPKPDPLPGSIS